MSKSKMLLVTLAGMMLVLLLQGCGATIQMGIGKSDFRATAGHEPKYSATTVRPASNPKSIYDSQGVPVCW